MLEPGTAADTLLAMPPPAAAEIHDYLAHRGEQLYVVRHRTREPPRAQALFCSPFALERTLAYTTLVRFARHLAHRGIEVIRFDYRGTGESSGRCEHFDFAHWADDTATVFEATRTDASPPRILFGLRFGALMASRLFADGHGDGLLAWGPFADARSMLHELLRHKVVGQALRGGQAGPGADREAFIAQWLREGVLEVDGHRWGKALWTQSPDLVFAGRESGDSRPRLILAFDRRPGHGAWGAAESAMVAIPRPPFWHYDPRLLPDLGDLLRRSFAFVETELSVRGDGVTDAAGP